MMWLLSCSFMVPKTEPCSSSTQCEKIFGMGYTCGVEGYCDIFAPHPRCTKTVPEDVYQNWESYSNSYIIGTLFKHGNDQANIVASSLAVEEARELPLDGTNNFVMIHCDYEAQDETGDGLSSSDAVRELSAYLGNEVGASLIIGPSDSGGSATAFNATTDTLFVSPSATSKTLSTIDGEIKSNDNPGRFWRTVASDALQASVLASVVQDEAADIAFLYENSVYGSDFVAIMEESFASSIQSTRYPYGLGDKEMAEDQRHEIGLRSHEAVVIISSDISELVQIITALSSDDNYSNQKLFFADGAADSVFLSATPALLGSGIQVFGSRPPLLEGALFNNFEALFALKAEEMGYLGLSAGEDVYSAYTYDATWIGIYGYAWAHFLGDPMSYLDLSRGLRKISDSEATGVDINSSSWSTVQAKFRSGESIDIQGTSGALDFNPLTEELESTVEIWTLNQDYDCFVGLYECDQQLNCSEELPETECENESDTATQFQGEFRLRHRYGDVKVWR